MRATPCSEDEARQWLAREGPDFLGRHDDGWFRRERLRAAERAILGLLPLAGLWWLDWPVEPLAVFLLLGILGQLAADWLKFALAPQAVRDRLWYDLLDHDLWNVISDLRAGRPVVRRKADPRIEQPSWQLLVSSGMLLCLVGSLLYELRKVSGIDLLQQALASPDMLLAMLAALCLQAILGALALGQLQRHPRPGQALQFAPIVEATMAFLVLFGWLVGSLLVVNAGGTLTGRDPGGTVVAVLVVAAYGLQILRAVWEWRWLPRARDMRDWLEQRSAPATAEVTTR